MRARNPGVTGDPHHGHGMRSTKYDSAVDGRKPASEITDAQLLETILARTPPEFYIVDRALNVHLHRSEPTAQATERLPDDIVAAVKPLLASPPFDSAVVPLRRDLALRVLRLHGAGTAHFALFLEPFRGRDLVEVAARKFALTAREAVVLDQVLRGSTTLAISQRLHITEGTVHQHVKNLGAKIGVTRRNAIIATVLGLAAA